MSKVDPKLVEIFEYNLGVDLNDPKYLSFRIELADYFKEQITKSIQELPAPKESV